jgi:hypothetical protein
MTRRSLFKFLSLAPAVPLVSAIPRRLLQPLDERSIAQPPNEEYLYTSIQFTGPALVWKSAEQLHRDLMTTLQEQWKSVQPLARVLAEDGKEIYHAGWLDLDGRMWSRMSSHDSFIARLAVYARPVSGAAEAYNTSRLARGYWNMGMERELLTLHEHISKTRISTPSSVGRAPV